MGNDNRDAGEFTKQDEARFNYWSTVSVVIGILAYLLLMVKSMFFTIFFGMFAFTSSLPECVAASGIQKPIGLMEIVGPSDPSIQAQLARSVDNQVNVTDRFQLVSIVLFLQNLLFLLLTCCCCCSGRSSAKSYDRLFSVYSVLLAVAIGTFTWMCLTRYSYTSRVCSGDFLTGVDEDTDILDVWSQQNESDYYLTSLGRLFKTYTSLESIWLIFCACAFTIWAVITPKAYKRLTTTVDEVTLEQQKSLLEERLAFKKQMRATEVMLHEQNLILAEWEAQRQLKGDNAAINDDDFYGEEADVYQRLGEASTLGVTLATQETSPPSSRLQTEHAAREDTSSP